MYHLIALSQHTKPDNFLVVPFLVRRHDDYNLFAYPAQPGRQPGHVDQWDYDAGLDSMEYRRASKLNHWFEYQPHGLIAVWLGADFIGRCRQLNVPLPAMAPGAITYLSPEKPDTVDGAVWFESVDEAESRLNAWLLKAAALAFQRHDREIARLMTKCQPLRQETLAARWFTAVSETDRRDALSYALRLGIASEAGLTREKIENRFRDIAARFRK